MSSADASGVVATIVDAPVRGEVRVRRDALLTFGSDGSIHSVRMPHDPEYRPTIEALGREGRLEQLASSQYLLPGLVDLHNHAPQWPQMGKALDVPLEVWLNEYTFPLEARYQDIRFADQVYRSLVAAMISNGTTTAVYFGTVHLAATQRLVDVCLESGQRAVIGKVAMDHPESCPEFYRDESAHVGVEATREFVEYVRAHPQNGSSLVLPAATPRFVPSCTDEMLAGLGELVAAMSCRVQTHCSESDWAHQYGLSRYGRTDTATYAEFGLLQRSTVLAHCNFINDSDMTAIAAAGAAVAHCPLSNVYFANAVFPARRALDRGVHVGLGTDISGGPSPSILRTAAEAVAASRTLEDGVDPGIVADERGVVGSRITFAEAFWMATTGGGLALDLPIGLLEPGYRFDAIAIDTVAAESDLLIWPEFDSDLDILQKIVHNTGRRDIDAVWIDGARVKSTSTG
jgi:guanine deaminase